MEGVLFRGQLGKSDQIVNDGPQGSFARYMGPSLVMVPTIKCNLVAGNSCLTKLTEQLFVQQITIGGHLGSILKAMLFSASSESFQRLPIQCLCKGSVRLQAMQAQPAYAVGPAQ